MAKPSSSTELCNLALDAVKETIIDDIAGTSKTEALCNRQYDLTRQRVLQSYNWSFALLSAAINRSGTPTIDNYPDYYDFPNNFLKLRAIIDPGIPLSQRDFEIQGNSLYYDNGGDATIDIWYTADTTSVSTWPALFIQLLVDELALVLGRKLTARTSVMKEVKESLIESRRLARAFDSQQRPPRRYESSKIVNAGLSPSTFRTVAGNYTFPAGMDD